MYKFNWINVDSLQLYLYEFRTTYKGSPYEVFSSFLNLHYIIYVRVVSVILTAVYAGM